MNKSIVGKRTVVQVDNGHSSTVIGEQVVVHVGKEEKITPDLKVDYLVYDIKEIISTFAKVDFADNVKHFEWFYDPMKGKVIFKFFYTERDGDEDI